MAEGKHTVVRFVMWCNVVHKIKGCEKYRVKQNAQRTDNEVTQLPRLTDLPTNSCHTDGIKFYGHNTANTDKKEKMEKKCKFSHWSM